MPIACGAFIGGSVAASILRFAARIVALRPHSSERHAQGSVSKPMKTQSRAFSPSSARAPMPQRAGMPAKTVPGLT